MSYITEWKQRSVFGSKVTSKCRLRGRSLDKYRKSGTETAFCGGNDLRDWK